MRTIVRLVALTLVVLAIWALPSRPGPVAAASITVNIDDDLYANSPTNNCPSPPAACVTNVHVGDTVHWVWMGIGNHSTTSDTGTPGVACSVSMQPWDSGIHGNGFMCNVTFNTAGSFAYHCTVHPTMHGTIVVTTVVGGIAELPNVPGAPAAVPASSKGDSGLLVGVLAPGAGVVALAGAAFYVRKLRVH